MWIQPAIIDRLCTLNDFIDGNMGAENFLFHQVKKNALIAGNPFESLSYFLFHLRLAATQHVFFLVLYSLNGSHCLYEKSLFIGVYVLFFPQKQKLIVLLKHMLIGSLYHRVTVLS